MTYKGLNERSEEGMNIERKKLNNKERTKMKEKEEKDSQGANHNRSNIPSKQNGKENNRGMIERTNE